MRRETLLLLAMSAAVQLDCAAAVVAKPHAATTQYPSRPVRLLTAGAAGGSDIASRIIADALAARLGQPVVVDSRIGGVIIAEIGAKAPADGYTVLLYSNALWLVPLMQEKPTYDALRDFAPITTVGSAPMVLVVNPSVSAKSVTELVALARARPGDLTSASGPRGAMPHLAAELFKSMAGLDYLVVSYRSVGAGVTDVLGGRVQLMFPNAGAGMAQVKAGKLRALAVSSLKPSAFAPGVPTIAESGFPGFEAVGTFGLFGPARVPPERIRRLNDEAVRVVRTGEVKDKLFAAGIDPAGTTSEDLRAQMQSEVSKIGKVIRAAKIRLD